MPHGLGSPQDFDPYFQPEEPQLTAEQLAENAALLGGPEENLGQEVEELEDPFEQAEVGEYLDEDVSINEMTQEEQEAMLLQYLSSLQPPYIIAPDSLALLVENSILTVEEARAYLAGKGVELG